MTFDARALALFQSLIYGEVDFHSFARVLRKINPVPGGVFYDLGSGTAKAVFVARFMHDFRMCVRATAPPSRLPPAALSRRARAFM